MLSKVASCDINLRDSFTESICYLSAFNIWLLLRRHVRMASFGSFAYGKLEKGGDFRPLVLESGEVNVSLEVAGDPSPQDLFRVFIRHLVFV